MAAAGPHLGQRIEAGYEELSPRERRAADFMLDHLGDLAVYSDAEVARLSGVSKATVSRLIRRLGFESSHEVREHVRAMRVAGTPVAARGTVATPSGYASHLEQELANLRAGLASLDHGALERTASLIAAARQVVVIGFRNGYPVALHLRQQLAQARDGVTLLPRPGQTLAEDLVGIGHDDVVVLVGVRRRPEAFGRVLDAAHVTGAPIVLLADPSAARHAARATVSIACPVGSAQAFDSYATAMSLVSLIASAVLDAEIVAGRRRIARINELYDELGELEGP